MNLHTTILTVALAFGAAGAPPESRAEPCTGIAPFGIPLAQPFSPELVARVVEPVPSKGGNVVRYEIKPSEPNPLFEEYSVTTTARDEMVHEVTARRHDCSEHCEADFRNLVAGLEAKYGPGTEIQETETEVQLQAQTFLWTLFGRDCRIRLEVTPPGPLELRYTDFSPPVREALQLGPDDSRAVPDPGFMRGL